MATSWIEANGAALRYELAGSGSPVLVLIHEMGGTLESWDDVVPALAGACRTLRYDLRGAGLSEKTPGALSLDLLADDLAALLDRLALSTPAVVAGCAVGAAVALHFAARHPARTAGVVAMAPATFLPAERRSEALARADRIECRGLRATLAVAQAPAADADESALAEILRCRRLGNDPRGVAALWRMLAGLAMERDYPRIRCPALVLAGSRDQSRPPALVETVARAIPGAEFRTLETGHVMPVETPALIIEVLRDFLRRITSAGADFATAKM